MADEHKMHASNAGIGELMAAMQGKDGAKAPRQCGRAPSRYLLSNEPVHHQSTARLGLRRQRAWEQR